MTAWFPSGHASPRIKPYALRKFYFLQASVRVAERYFNWNPYRGNAISFTQKLPPELAVIMERSRNGYHFMCHELPGNHTKLVKDPNARKIADVFAQHLMYKPIKLGFWLGESNAFWL